MLERVRVRVRALLVHRVACECECACASRACVQGGEVGVRARVRMLERVGVGVRYVACECA